MSLKARLRLSFLLLTFTVVSAISFLHVRSVAESRLRDAGERAQITGEQVQAFAQRQLLTRMSAAGPTANALENAGRWRRLLATDRHVGHYLVQALDNSPSLTAIDIVDLDGTLLVSSQPASPAAAGPLPSYGDWLRGNTVSKLLDLARNPRQFTVRVKPPPDGSAGPLFAVRATISSLLLREALLPELRDLLVVSGACLLASVVLAFLFSNVALMPLATISRRLDEINAGPGSLARLADTRPESDEMAQVEQKLAVLNRDFQGARAGAVQLRSQVESMLQQLEEAVLLFDSDGKLLLAGQPAERLVGVSHPLLTGMTLEDLFPPYTPQGRVIHDAVRLRQSVRDQAITMDRHGLPGARVLVNVDVLEGIAAGDRPGALVTLRDADTRREVAAHLDTATRLEAINRLTAGVAHELKNPLNAIALHLEVLRTKVPADTAGPELDVLQRELTRLDRALRAFVEFTKPYTLHLRPLSVQDVTRQLCEEMRDEALLQGVEIGCQAEGECPVVSGDAELLRNALRNLVRNALEAIDGPGRIDLRVRRSSGDCLVTVTDTGRGIAPEMQDRIYQLYTTTKPNALGMGLAVVFQVVQLHQGTIDFLTEPGQGTTFRMRLPALDGAEAKPEPASVLLPS